MLHFEATGDAKGKIDPISGSVSLDLNIDVSPAWRFSPPFPTSCKLAGVALHVDTSGGKAYDPATGTATLVDASFALSRPVG